MLDGNNTTKSWELKPYMCICMFLFFLTVNRSCTQITKVMFPLYLRSEHYREDFSTARLSDLLVFVTDCVMDGFLSLPPRPYYLWICTSEKADRVYVGNKCSFNTTSYEAKTITWTVLKWTVMHSIGNSGSKQPEITTELSSAIYQSMAKINRNPASLIVWNLLYINMLKTIFFFSRCPNLRAMK